MLDGTWELNCISGPRISYEGLYPGQKTTICFNVKENKVAGKNSGTSYFGTLAVEGTKIVSKVPIGDTKMFCLGEGENIYMTTLQKK